MTKHFTFKNGRFMLSEGMEYNVACLDNKAKYLTGGKRYIGKLDKTGKFRVKDDAGKMSAFSTMHFDCLGAVEGAVLPSAMVDDDVDKAKLERDLAETIGVIEATTGEKVSDVIREELKKEILGGRIPSIGDLKDAIKEVKALKSIEPKKEEVRAMPKKSPHTPVTPTKAKRTLRDYLEEQGVKPSLIDQMNAYRVEHNVDEAVNNRQPILKQDMLYRGDKVLNQAIAALLKGHNILLEGEKATGKNVLAMNLAWFFGRPMWDISCHSHIDAPSLIGSDTLKNGNVVFKPGAIHEVGTYGGFGVIDEINMARSEAVAVLHSVLDSRRVIDVSGYEKTELHECTRFIGTMNYGYVGTKELNEALVSRFDVIHVPALEVKELTELLHASFKHIAKSTIGLFVKIFNDLRIKAKNGEISTRSVDLRGIKNAIELCDIGLKPFDALESCIINKAFEEYERNVVRDTCATIIHPTTESLDGLVRIS